MDVLVVSEDENLLETFEAEFASAGLNLRVVRLLASLAEALRQELPSAIVLDLDIAEPPPWDVVRSLHVDPHTARLPLIAVSGRYTDSPSVLQGLRLGAVEYISKPLQTRVLIARLQALADALSRRRRTKGRNSLGTADGRLELDLEAHRCRIHPGSDGKGPAREIHLSPREFLLLELLLGKKSRLVTKDDIFSALWPKNRSFTEGNKLTLAQHIASLRRKLGPLKSRLATVWGLGYRFE